MKLVYFLNNTIFERNFIAIGNLELANKLFIIEL